MRDTAEYPRFVRIVEKHVLSATPILSDINTVNGTILKAMTFLNRENVANAVRSSTEPKKINLGNRRKL